MHWILILIFLLQLPFLLAFDKLSFDKSSLDKPPLNKKNKTRIASLALVTDEILVDLKLPKDQYEMILLSHFSQKKSYSNIHVKNVPLFYGEPEEIAKAKPDIVLYASFNRPSIKNYIKNQKFKAVELKSFQSIEDIKKNTLMISDAVGYQRGANKLVKDMNIKPCKEASRKSILSYSENLVFSGKKSLLNDLLSQVGFQYAPADIVLGPYGKITEEKIISMKPHYLLVDDLQKIKDSGSWHYVLKNKPKIIRVPRKILSSVNHYAFRLTQLICQQIKTTQKRMK